MVSEFETAAGPKVDDGTADMGPEMALLQNRPVMRDELPGPKRIAGENGKKWRIGLTNSIETGSTKCYKTLKEK